MAYYRRAPNACRSRCVISPGRLLPAFVRAAGPFEWVFSLRLFVAGMAALYLALWLGLEDPKWSLMTVYIVGQSMAGMTLAKGFYRFLGTLVGAMMALLLTGLLVSTPAVLLLALSLWMALCTFGASLLRNFRSYGFVLAGYSAVIIGMPALLDPAHAFNIAQARVIEISLGIFCSTLMAMLVWPRSAGDHFLASAHKQFYSLLHSVAEVAAGSLSNADFQARRQQLVTASVELQNLREHALFDSQHLRHHAASCRRFCHEMLSLVSTLGPLQAYVKRYAETYQLPQQKALLERLAQLDKRADASQLRGELLALHSDAQRLAQRQREEIETTGADHFYAGQLLLENAAEICDRLRSAMVLNAMITGEIKQVSWRAGASRLHLDKGQALRNSIRVLVAMLAAVAFWWWSASAQAVECIILVAVVCSLFATRDNPATAARSFMKGAVVAALAAFVYYLILVHADGFMGLALWLMPFYVIAGLAKSYPATMGNAGAMLVFFPELLDLGPHQVFSMTGLANGFIGLVMGMGFSVFAFLLLWPGDKAPQARLRLCRDLCRVVADWPILKGARRSRHQLETQLYDRLAKTYPQLQAKEANDARLLQDSMAVVTQALGLFYLSAICRRGLPTAARDAVMAVIEHTQLALAEGGDRWQQVEWQVSQARSECLRLYPLAVTAGARRRLVRSLVQLRMQKALLANHREFFMAGSKPGHVDWQEGIYAA